MKFLLSPKLIISTCLFSAFAISAHATPVVVNGSFEQTTLSNSGRVNNNDLTGWTTTSGFTFLVFPGTATTSIGGGIKLWPGSGFPATSPDGGNFIASDGTVQPGPLSQTLNGLTVGASYQISFWQAAAQEFGFSGDSTNRWLVSLGADSQLSSLMNTPSHQFSDWNYETLTFQASATSEILSFFADGAPAGVPPFSLLDGVSITQVPEPSTWALMIFGLLGVWGARKRYKNHT